MRKSELCMLLLVLLQLMWETTTKGTPTHGGQLKCVPDFIGGAHKTDAYKQQLILTDYIFDCSAVITKWEANIMGHMPSSIVEFQVWRLQQQQSRYVLVGTNTYPSTTGGSRRRNKLTLQVSTQQIIVQPGDIVGIFISSDGDYKIEFDGRRHDTSISTYIATSDVPLRGFNSSDLGGFQELAGAPLIRVTVEEVEPSTIVPLPVRTIETSMTSLTTVFTYPDTSTTPVPPVQPTTVSQTIPTTPDVGKRSEREVSLWQEHQSLFISVAVCGFILVLLCIALVIVLGLYIKTRLKQRVDQEHTTGEEDTVNRQRHSSMFSLFPLDTARRNNLIAFKRKQTAPKVITTSMDAERRELGNSEREYEDMYDFASSTRIDSKPQGSAKDELQISMKENPSYTVLSEKQPKGNVCNIETQGSLEQSENVYDVPIFARPLPCEYEVPTVSGSPVTSASYITPQSQSMMPHYENAAAMERSNVYTEIDI